MGLTSISLPFPADETHSPSFVKGISTEPIQRKKHAVVWQSTQDEHKLYIWEVIFLLFIKTHVKLMF